MPDTAAEFIALQSALVGRYSLERELGQGGMGIVFLARDVALDRPVAIKLLPPAMAAQPALRERFLREARTAAKLSHPNIVPIHAVEAVGDLVFFVMGCIEGETLGERLRAKGPLNPTDGARLLQEVAWALAYAHGRGIVHRDVKPDNILIERGSARTIVTDFGIARVAETAAAAGAREVVGTPQYMSPEQANADPVDGRSDLYSLGVVGFLALSGRLPFEAADAEGVLAMHITAPPPPLGALAPGVPRKLAQAIDRCLVKAPAERFATGEELAEAIATSAERPREVPAPVRLWLTKGQENRGVYAVWMVMIFLPALIIALGLTAGGEPGAVIAWAVALGIFSVPFGLQALHRLYHTRRLLGAGYGLEDMRFALRTHAERRREELAFEYDRDPPLLARVIRYATFAAFGTLVVSLALAMAGVLADAAGTAVSISGLVTLVGALIGRVYPGIRLPARDPTAERRLKIWSGRLGAWFARLAGLGLKHRAIPADMTHRPTELAIGLAANALFETLPKEIRKELKDLPAIMRRLESDAQSMRKRVEELNDALASLSDESAAGRSLALRPEAAGEVSTALADQRAKLAVDLTATRDEAAKRLATAVAALENIRLDLLRLKAGAGSVAELTADLTADLSAARDIGAEIDATIVGREEVEALLRARRSSRHSLPRVSGSRRV